METLATFYRCKQWTDILKVIKIERVNDNGEIICEYCGKPITRAYDIIGHHKEALTEDNVNDATVALNPDNVALVHHRCHNYIHNKLGYKERNVFLVYGPPMAGKSTYARDNAEDGDLIVDMNNVWPCITGKAQGKPPRLNAVAFKVRDTLLEAVRYRVGKWNNAYVVGGYPLQSERERLCKELGAREVFLDCTKDVCLNRLHNADNISDKASVEAYIDDWFNKYNRAL